MFRAQPFPRRTGLLQGIGNRRAKHRLDLTNAGQLLQVLLKLVQVLKLGWQQERRFCRLQQKDQALLKTELLFQRLKSHNPFVVRAKVIGYLAAIVNVAQLGRKHGCENYQDQAGCNECLM